MLIEHYDARRHRIYDAPDYRGEFFKRLPFFLRVGVAIICALHAS